MTSINNSKHPKNIDNTELSIRHKRYKQISVVVAAGMGLGLVAISAGFTQAALTPSPNQTKTISNSPMLLAQSVNKNLILAAHNKYRQQLGVPGLKWSDSLASSAQKWAKQLASRNQLQHSSGNYGENIWAGTKGRYTQTQMVEAWGSEKQYFIANSAFPNTCKGGWQKCGHYTQIIWKNTTEVGCGLAKGTQMDYLVCQYNPPGNFQGQKPY